MGSFLSGAIDILTHPVEKISRAIGIGDNLFSRMERPASEVLGKDSQAGKILDNPVGALTNPKAVPDVPAAPPIPTTADPTVVAAEDTAARAARSKRGRASNYLMGTSGSNSLLDNSGGFFQPILGG